MGGHFDIPFSRLPINLPVFPLGGALLLPRGRLPLNIFEPRYIAMVLDALAGERMIGLIQPDAGSQDDPPALSQTGCAGRISSFMETEDGRLLIALSGVCRFRVKQEVSCDRAYRMVMPDWEPYRGDLTPDPAEGLEHSKMLALMRPYFEQKRVPVDWDDLSQLTTEAMVNFLAMFLPFTAEDKQLMLEAETVTKRYRVLQALLENASDGTTRH